ncbi:MAG: thioredoxin domain-containing protein, partial [Candidatus Binatia bacterium]
HWCHVMEEESFEDVEIAEYLNQHYLAIKVDREQRPDIDGVYMAAVQMMTGSGGWPMTVWLTPDRKPFYGGTYFPPRDGMRGVSLGFLTLLRRLQETYHQEPEKVGTAAGEIAQRIRLSLAPDTSQGALGAAVLRAGAETLKKTFDAQYGGFGTAPKFSRSVNLEFLLRYSRRTGDTQARDMVVKTLEAMSSGGIHDHLDGGFHRYATDRQWLVPHFEKMLYDNALLVVAYLEAYQATGREEFARVARKTLDYVTREMTSPDGAFYSATDADSEGEEGKFFTWTFAEVEKILGDQAKLFCAYYGVTERGNFDGKNILHIARSLSNVAREFNVSQEQVMQQLSAARVQLLAVRQKRIPPHTDTKVLVSWNGLMISAFAHAAFVLHEPTYAQQARRAAEFILTQMKTEERLRRSALNGVVTGTAYLDDYAFFAAGLLDLYESTFELRWLREAISLQRTLETYFLDKDGGGFFLTPVDGEKLLAREKPNYDGPEPSGNSVAVQNLLRLAAFTTNDHYWEMAQQALRAFAGQLTQSPASMPRLLTALDFSLDKPKEIVIVTPDAETTAEPFFAKLRTAFVPNRILVVTPQGSELERQQQTIPLLQFKIAIGGKVTAYVCEQQICALPTEEPAIFGQQVTTVEPLPEPL